MSDPAEMESMRYEALIDSLKRPEANKREALEEFVRILGKKNLKPYQEKLVEATINYFEHSRQYREGPHIRCAKELVEDVPLYPNSETSHYSPDTTVAFFERIISTPDAHEQIRRLFLDKLLESGQYTDKTIDFVVETIFAEDVDKNQKEFVANARDLAFKSADASIGSKLEPGSSPDKLRRFVLDKFATNQLREPEMWKLFRSIAKERTSYARELLAISKLEGVDASLRELAAEEVIKLAGDRA